MGQTGHWWQLLCWKPHSIRFFCPFVVFLEVRSCYVAQDDPKLTMKPRLVPTSSSSSLHLLGVVIDYKCVPPRMAHEICDICDTALPTAWMVCSRFPEPSWHWSAAFTEWHFSISSLFSNPQKPPFYFLLEFDYFESLIEKKSCAFTLLWQAYSQNSSHV